MYSFGPFDSVAGHLFFFKDMHTLLINFRGLFFTHTHKALHSFLRTKYISAMLYPHVVTVSSKITLQLPHAQDSVF